MEEPCNLQSMGSQSWTRLSDFTFTNMGKKLLLLKKKKKTLQDFSGGPVAGNVSVNAEDTGSIPGPGRSHMPWSNKPMDHNY